MTQDRPDTDVRALIENIVRALVDRPETVWVTETVGQHTTVFEVWSDDSRTLRQAIGRDGVYAEAIRTLIAAIGGKHRRRYILEAISAKGESASGRA